MTVKELFQMADSELILYAYLMIEPPFDDFLQYDVQTKAEGISEIKSLLNRTIKRILEADYVKDMEPSTVFVMSRTDTEYGKQYIQHTEAFLVKDKEAIETCDKNFTIWNDAGDCRIEHYALDFIEPENIAQYAIAEESIKHMGVETCCAAILNEICFWGVKNSSDTLEDGDIEEFEDVLAAATEDIEACRVYTIDNVEDIFNKFEEDIESNMSEEELEYRRFVKEFKDKVRDIEFRHLVRITDDDHRRYIEAIKYEYQRRKYE